MSKNCVDCTKTRDMPKWAKCLDTFSKNKKECNDEEIKKNSRCPCPPKSQPLDSQSIYHVQQSKKKEKATFINQQRGWTKAVYDSKTRKYIILSNNKEICR